MKKGMTKTSVSYTIDLTQIDGDGAFPCPKCGTIISPEDETETVYKIVDTKVVNYELVELIIKCGKCGNDADNIIKHGNSICGGKVLQAETVLFE